VDGDMAKAVLFDLDGTLLNRAESIETFIEGQYYRFEKYLQHIPLLDYSSRFIELDCGGYVWKDQVYMQMVKEFHLVKLPWQRLLEDYLIHFKDYCIGFPYLHRLMEELRKNAFLMGIVSNGKGVFQTDNIKALGIHPYLKSIVISEWAGVQKPDSAIFNLAVEEIGVKPSECWFVGDHPEKDIKGAKKAGLKTIWKKHLRWDDAIDADFIIQDLMEIMDIVSTGRSLSSSINRNP
jgi:putative hydrolase of the HAD superfamily